MNNMKTYGDTNWSDERKGGNGDTRQAKASNLQCIDGRRGELQGKGRNLLAFNHPECGREHSNTLATISMQ
jgi:hypothetical protein